MGTKNSSKSPCDPDPTILPSYIRIVLVSAISSEVPPSSNQKGEITITIKEQYFARIKCNPTDTVEQAVFKFWLQKMVVRHWECECIESAGKNYSGSPASAEAGGRSDGQANVIHCAR